jgi:hypothetical protein
MRKCPRCGETYDDTWKVCLTDKTTLIDESGEEVTSVAEPKTGEKFAKTRGLGFFAIFLLFHGLFAGLFMFIAAISGPPDADTKQSFLRMAIFSYSGIISIGFLVSAVGLLMYKKWARPFTIAISSITIATLIFWTYSSLKGPSVHPELAASNMPLILMLFADVSLFISLIFYLTRPRVKAQFR